MLGLDAWLKGRGGSGLTREVRKQAEQQHDDSNSICVGQRQAP